MPIYEYICTQCKTEFELRLSFSEANCTPLCPKCYSEAQRLISIFSCKTGGNLQAAGTPFRAGEAPGKSAGKKVKAAPDVLITPPPNRIELLSPPGKKSLRTRRQKK